MASYATMKVLVSDFVTVTESALLLNFGNKEFKIPSDIMKDFRWAMAKVSNMYKLHFTVSNGYYTDSINITKSSDEKNLVITHSECSRVITVDILLLSKVLYDIMEV